MQTRQFRPQIAKDLTRDAYITGDEVKDRLIRFAFVVQFEQWDAQAFLIKFCCVAAISARRFAPDVGVVSDADDEGDGG